MRLSTRFIRACVGNINRSRVPGKIKQVRCRYVVTHYDADDILVLVESTTYFVVCSAISNLLFWLRRCTFDILPFCI